MSPTMHRSLLAAALLLFTVGCNEGPTEPSRTIPFTGALVKDNPAKLGTLSMQHTGNVRVTLVELKLTAADGTVGPAPGGLFIGVGSGSSPLSCIADGSFVLAEGGLVSLGLEKGDYCLSFQGGLEIAEGTTITYSVTADIRD